MNKNIKQLVGIAAALLLSISLIAMNNPTLANSIKGFFKDIKNYNGAIVGTEYNESTAEIQISTSNIIIDENKVFLPIEVTLKDISKAPFNEIDVLTIDKFKINHISGSEINYENIKVESISQEDYSYEIQDENKILTEIKNQDLTKRVFMANLIIDKDKLILNDEYILKIESFYGHKKADAPIKINGNWKIDFIVE